MSIELKVPPLPESIADATVAKWYKKPGDAIKRDENLVDLETDKVMLEVPAPFDGVLEKIIKPEGSTVTASEAIASLKEGAGSTGASAEKTSAAQSPAASPVAAKKDKDEEKSADLSPALRRLVAMENIDVTQIQGTGKGGRITKEDIAEYKKQQSTAASTTAPAAAPPKPPAVSGVAPADAELAGWRTEKRVPMSRLRQRIAERLVQVQHEAALLTTFNEVNMQAVMDLRKKYNENFEKKFGVRLGFMSFFTKAAVEALKQYPAVNASIDGQDVLYHNYYDIGIAVSSERGLVVPVLRNVENMGMADIEKQIGVFAQRAKTGALTLEEMTGGTFTITNGGTFGSMLSTPIINPPQAAILGMHNIVERPVAEKGAVVIRPIMYLALSYDHRLIDGREAVRFLVAIKEMLEDPARLALGF